MIIGGQKQFVLEEKNGTFTAKEIGNMQRG